MIIVMGLENFMTERSACIEATGLMESSPKINKSPPRKQLVLQPVSKWAEQAALS